MEFFICRLYRHRMETAGPYSYEVGEELVVEAMRRHMMRRMTHGLIGKLLIAVVVLLVMLIALDVAFYGRLSNVSIAFVIAVPLAIAIVNLRLVPNLGRRQYRQSAALRASTAISWDDEAIGFTSDRGQARVPMAELYRWDETENIVLLYQTEMYFNIVPKAALHGAAADLVARLQAAGVRRG